MVLSLLAVGFSGVFLISPASAESLGSWTPTTSYPAAVYLHSCASYSGYVYCVAGGATDSGNGVYYAQASSSGVGAWSSTTSYPSFIGGLSCATYSGYIYCVGGGNIVGDIDNVNYAPVSSSGVGTWTSTTAYPSAITDESCAISSGYIYCVGGTSDSLAGITGHVYYAPVSSSGVGAWTQSTGYPFPIENTSCFIASGYIYCVAGFALSGYTSVVYYAPISASGVGAWTATTYYPTAGGYLSCATSYGVVYCVDGTNSNGSADTDAVYYGLLSTPGVISWTSTSNYPLALVDDSCVASSGIIACVGGVGYGTSAIDNVYYASIAPPGVTVTSTATSTTTTTTTTILTSTVTTPTTTTSTTTLPPIITTTTTTTNVIATSTTTSTTTVATEGSLETTIQANQGTPSNPGDTVFSLLYGLGSSLTSLSNTIATDFGGVTSSLANIQSALSALQTGQTSLTGTITTDFASVVSSLTNIQSTISTLSTNITTDFSTVDSNLASITSTLSSIQTSVNSLSSSQSHNGLTGSASGETTLTSTAPSATIYTTPNGKVAIVGVSVNATLPSPLFFPQAGPLVIRFYTDPSNPNVYVQQSVTVNIFGISGNSGNGYVGTGAAWKVVLVATIPTHDSSSIKTNWAVSSMGPQ